MVAEQELHWAVAFAQQYPPKHPKEHWPPEVQAPPTAALQVKPDSVSPLVHVAHAPEDEHVAQFASVDGLQQRPPEHGPLRQSAVCAHVPPSDTEPPPPPCGGTMHVKPDAEAMSWYPERQAEHAPAVPPHVAHVEGVPTAQHLPAISVQNAPAHLPLVQSVLKKHAVPAAVVVERAQLDVAAWKL